MFRCGYPEKGNKKVNLSIPQGSRKCKKKMGRTSLFETLLNILKLATGGGIQIGIYSSDMEV